MIIKTEELYKKFLNDLKYICFGYNQYLANINKVNSQLSRGDKTVFKSGYGNQPFRPINFIGSFFVKKFAEYVSDIDLAEYVNFDEIFINRLKLIIKNIDSSPFIFQRFYCGEDLEMIPPWKIDGKGSCNFSLNETEEWFEKMKINPFLEPTIVTFLENKLNSSTLSLKDLLEVEEEMKKHHTISWKKEDIINGYVDFHGKRYDLLKTIRTYSGKRTIRYLYTVNENDGFLIDYSIRHQDTKMEEGIIESRIYYMNDSVKILKNFKRWIDRKYTEDYNNIVNKFQKKYSTIAYRMDMIIRARKYKNLPEHKLEYLQNDLNTYMQNCGKEYNQFLINTENIQEKYSLILDAVKNEAKNGIQEIIDRNYIFYQNKKIMAIYEIRAIDAQEKISKKLIRYRIDNKYECPFFPVSLQDVNHLYQLCQNSLLNPITVYKCITEVCKKYNTEKRNIIKICFNDKLNWYIKTQVGYSQNQINNITTNYQFIGEDRRSIMINDNTLKEYQIKILMKN
jgi:hypothetical protein